VNAAGGEVQSRDPRARRAGVRDADVRRGAPKHVAAARRDTHAPTPPRSRGEGRGGRVADRIAASDILARFRE